MCQKRYSSTPVTATKQLFRSALLLALMATFISACSPKQPVQISPEKPGTEQARSSLATPPQSSREIDDLMLLAREQGDVESAIGQLAILAKAATPPLNEEAAFRRVELLLEYQYPEAVTETEQLLARYPEHALAPYARYWLAQWWSNSSEDEQAMTELLAVLMHPRLTRELLDKTEEMGAALAPTVSENTAVQWYLTAAHIDNSRRDYWLRAAANRASLATLESLHNSGRISPRTDSDFYLQFARLRLIAGQTQDIANLLALLEHSAAPAMLTNQIRRWASGELQPATIGILLPLSGPYARYGMEALNGIRLALSEHNYQQTVTLRIEDTADSVLAAYQRLSDQHVDWIIGPLLSSNASTLATHLKDNTPVISLTRQSDLAALSPALFVHNIAREAQASFLAEHLHQQGAQRATVIFGNRESDSSEANAFIDTFTAQGGEVAGVMQLGPERDHRPALRQLREETDDEELLAELDEELALFSADTELEIRMPVGFDALYLAMSGSEVAQMTGQLAYVGISGIPLLGSDAWRDGHLLDDHGRYLSKARFTQIGFPENAPAALLSAYRQTWGSGQPGKLFGIAYDTALIAALISSRLGLHGKDAIRGLQDERGFPCETGHVRFDKEGVGHKQFDIFTIRRNNVVPAS